MHGTMSLKKNRHECVVKCGPRDNVAKHATIGWSVVVSYVIERSANCNMTSKLRCSLSPSLLVGGGSFYCYVGRQCYFQYGVVLTPAASLNIFLQLRVGTGVNRSSQTPTQIYNIRYIICFDFFGTVTYQIPFVNKLRAEEIWTKPIYIQVKFVCFPVSCSEGRS